MRKFIVTALLFLSFGAQADQDCIMDFGSPPGDDETYLLRVHSDDERHDPHLYFIYTLTIGRQSALCSELGLLSHGSRIFEVSPGIRTEVPVEENSAGHMTRFYRSKIVTVTDGDSPGPPTVLVRNANE